MKNKRHLSARVTLGLTALGLAIGAFAWRNCEREIVHDHGVTVVRGGKISANGHAAWTRLPLGMSLFRIDTGKSVTDLTDLLSAPGVAGWGGPYASSLEDMWGTPVRLESNGEEHLIRSAGRDKVFNTDDDATVK